MQRFTLHVRLTKKCNADCSYCSSFLGSFGARMKPDAFEAALSFIDDTFLEKLAIGGPLSHLSIEYVGGEILTLPKLELRDIVLHARERFSRRFGVVRDGVQSNLIGSEERVLELDTLFNGRIGTSVDRLGDQRTVKGDPDLYRRVRDRSVARIEKRRRRQPGAIYVVDRPGLGRVQHEVDQADANGHSLVLRPVFEGGKGADKAELSQMVDVLGDVFDRWAMRSKVAVEPFIHLLRSRLSVLRSGTVPAAIASCPFQRNCAEVSLNLEPNGDLFVCLDMADSDQFRLGNALTREFDWALWEELRNRKSRRDPKCEACPFVLSCQGGCMSAAIHDTGSMYGRPDLCALWTRLFEKIDRLVAANGVDAVDQWARELA